MAKVIGGIGKFLLGGGLLGSGVKAAVKAVAGGKKNKQAQAPLAMVSRDEATASIDDELLRRRGGAADILTGATGAEAALSGGKLVLGS